MSFRANIRILLPCAFLAVLTATPTVEAQAPANPALEVNRLYKEAKIAFEAGDFEKACPKFEEVVKLKPLGLGARVALGTCYSEAGDFMRAFDAYRAVLETAPEVIEKSSTAKEKDTAEARVAEAENLLENIKPKIGLLTIEIAATNLGLPGFLLRVDGAEIPTERINKAHALLPGKHVVEASATGFVAERREIQAEGGEPLVVPIELAPEKPAIQKASPDNGRTTTEPPNPPKTSPAKSAETPKASEPAKSSSTGKTPAWAWIAGGAGLVALGGATGFAFDYRATRNNAARDCADTYCNRPGLADEYESRWNRDVAWMAGLGSLGATGIIMFLTGIGQSSPSAETPALGLAPFVGPNASGIQIHGAF